MKLVKMSLAAAMLMGVSAFAVDNVKISGDAQVVYGTWDADGVGYDAVAVDTDGALFDKDSSAADAALHLNVSADLLPGISAGASYTAISSLGLENNFVSNVWASSHTASVPNGNNYANTPTTQAVLGIGGAKVENSSWFNEAWAAVTLGHTTAKVGRMALDTPLAFTETWSVEQNTFEAAVLLNQDLPDTTLVAAYVGNGNGTEFFGDGGANWSNVYSLGLAYTGIVNGDGAFSTYGTDGAYAFGIVNNSFKPLTVQAWYYDVTRTAQAYWIQADLNMEGIMLGGQYTDVDAGDLTGLDADNAFAVMAGFATDAFTIKGSYSSVSDNGVGAGWNTATNLFTAQSKLYTEAWWNYGYVAMVDATSFNITGEASLSGFDLGAYYTSVSNDTMTTHEVNELTITAGTQLLGALDATLAYINTDAKDQNNGDAYNAVQVYLTLNF
ncbi:hypothetical protein WCX49_02905 [Sulfurimonas sp. HSL-1656]|uniref:hypothetical protein n=1 Tax=Thiomicrolovo subterrani TaxID=3131934 RepID=UPI0031F96E89